MLNTWVRKALVLTTPVVVSTAVTVLLVTAVLPETAQDVVGWTGPVVLVLLLAGQLETIAIKILCGARSPTAIERELMAPAIAITQAHGLEPGTLLVDRHPVANWAIGIGRRTVVISPDLLSAINANQVGADEAAAITGRASAVNRAGLTRNDPAIIFWTIPWRLLASLVATRALGGVLALAWALRPVVGAVAVYEALTTDPASYGLAAAVTGLLAVTYLQPRFRASWDTYVATTADDILVAHGLGRPLGTYLRRTARPSIALTSRLTILDPLPAPRPALRIVS